MLRRGWPLALALLLVPAAADARTLDDLAPAPAGVDAVAYAGADRVYATGRALLRVRPGEPAHLVARLHGRAVQIDASETTVAVIERRGRARRLLAGPPSGPLRELARCRGPRPEIPFSMLAVAGDVVAEALTCETARGAIDGAAGIRVHAPGGVRTVPAAPGERFIALAGAPGALAWTVQAENQRGPLRVDVSEPGTGALRYTVGGLPEPFFPAPLAVAPDASSVFCGAGDRMAWASPAAPAAQVLAGVRCPIDVAVADGRIAYRDERRQHLRVAGFDGRRRTLVRGAGGLPFDWDGERLLVAGLGCAADFVGERTASGPAYRGPSCRVRIVRVTRGRSRAVARVTVACRPGCRGEVEIALGHGGRYDGAVLRLRRSGRHTVRVRLSRRAARLLRDYRAVPFHVTATYLNPRDGTLMMPQVERSGTLPGDGARPFPPPPPPGGD